MHAGNRTDAAVERATPLGGAMSGRAAVKAARIDAPIVVGPLGLLADRIRNHLNGFWYNPPPFKQPRLYARKR